MTHMTDKQAVLIVDDIPENLFVLEQVLKKLDVEIIKASNGREALDLFSNHRFSLVILDVLMPEMSGYEVAETMKKDERNAQIPIIFMTAMDQNESMELMGYSVGAVDYIFKPFNEVILLSKAKILLDLYNFRNGIWNSIANRKIERPKVLIVDDIPENLLVLERMLDKFDIEVIKARTGNEALARTLDHDFALIILDVQMPEMDGFEVAEILKTEDATASIPIIFVTAIDRDKSKEIRGYDKGAIDFIYKPFNEFILLSKVRIFLEIYKVRMGLEELVAERTADLLQTNRKLKEEIIKKEQAEKELVKTKSYLDNIINSMPSVLIGIDAGGKIIDINTAAEKLSNIPTEEAKGKPIVEIFPQFSDYLDEMKQTMVDQKIKTEEKIAQTAHGERRFYNLTIFPLIANGVQGAVVRIDDVTERVRLEEIMIQSEKMMSVGGLAAGLAHEINNPLAGILQNVQVIRRRLSDELPANTFAAEEAGMDFADLQSYLEKRGILEVLDAISESGKRAATIIKNMLFFSHKGDLHYSVYDMRELLDQTVDLVASDYDLRKKCRFDHIKIVREYEDVPVSIACEGPKIQQVFFNLLKNGAQAIAEGETEDPRFILRIKRAGNWVNIEIEDNGRGMEEAVRRRVFEPFYTTKDIGIGTGLGLSVSYFIITEGHKGTMEVESSPGKGAKFIIRLPIERK